MTDFERPFDPNVGPQQAEPQYTGPHTGPQYPGPQPTGPQYAEPYAGPQYAGPQYTEAQQTGPQSQAAWPVPQPQLAGGQYGHQPPPQYRNVRPPADKSVGAALVLTFLFGSFGLFYTSILGGLIMTVVEVIAVIVSVLTLGVGLVLFLLIWPATMIWGALSASRRHRKFEMWRVQQFQMFSRPQ